MVFTITGATGHVGGELVRLLSAADAPTRALFRDAAKIQLLPRVAWVRADLREDSVLEAALAGTTRLFLLTDNTPGFGALQVAVLRLAEQLGVEHVVKLSALGASDHSKSRIAREHWEVEQALQQMSIPWTILRPHSFMQNWLGDVARTVREEGALYSAIAEQQVPFIDTRDIANVAADILLNPAHHAGRKYVLTGGEAVGYTDLARMISDVIGRPVSYRQISLEAARARLEAQGEPPALVEPLMAILAYQRAGGPTAKVSGQAQELLGRRPRTIADFVRDHASHFMRRGE